MSADKTYRWEKLAETEEEIPFAPNHIAVMEAGGRSICIGRYQNNLFAFTPKCPHAGGFFTNGFIDAMGNVVCPLHRYRFCMKNGRNVSGEGYYLKHWPLEVREDGIYVGFEKNKLFGLF